jgi:hypothetical protein
LGSDNPLFDAKLLEFSHKLGSGRLSRISTAYRKQGVRVVASPLSTGREPPEDFLRCPTGHQKSKVGFTTLLLVGV